MYQAISGTGDGGTPVVNLTWSALSPTHVVATVDGAEVPYTWTGASQITFDDPVAAGSAWEVSRQTPAAAIVDFTDGSVLTEGDLDMATSQALFRQEEIDWHIDVSAAAAAQAASDADTAAATASAAAGVASTAIDTLTSPAIPASDRAALAALQTTLPALLMEAGREGTFFFDPSDLSSEVAADTAQGIHVAPVADPTGASGAWVRRHSGGKDPRWFGAVGDGVTDDTAAFQAAVIGGGAIVVPNGHNFQLDAGGIEVPSNTHFIGLGGTILFGSATGSQFTFVIETDADPGADAENFSFTGLSFYSDVDREFMQLVRMSNFNATIDGVRFNGNDIVYDPPSITGGDRWALVGAGEGTRKNIQVNNNRLTGPMQLTGLPGGAGTLQHVQVVGNRIHNAKTNAISLLFAGTLGKTNTLEDVLVHGNDISADAYTAVGVVLGLDSAQPDQNVNLRRIAIGGNRINIAASGVLQADIYIRFGNLMGASGGFDSEADSISLHGNELYGGVFLTQETPSLGGLSQVSKFVFAGNRVYGGDITLAHLADGAVLMNNMTTDLSPLRLGANNGLIHSSGNKWSRFIPINSSAEFTVIATNDDFIGKSVSTDRPIQLTADVGKVQRLYLESSTANSPSPSPFSAVRVSGTGTNEVFIRNLSTHTVWANGRYERTAGTIIDYTGGEVSKSGTFTPANPLVAGTADSVRTIAAPGAQLGDAVQVGHSNDLQGAEIVAWVSAADTISFYVRNPADNPNGDVVIGTGHVKARFISKDA